MNLLVGLDREVKEVLTTWREPMTAEEVRKRLPREFENAPLEEVRALLAVLEDREGVVMSKKLAGTNELTYCLI
jgi:hypothetical protein